MPPRRAVLGALVAAACAGPEEAPPPLPAGPPSYSHLTPLRLSVGRIEFQPGTDAAATRTMPPAPLNPADVVRIMAQERLSAAGGPGIARFRVQIATLTREGSASGGVFTAATERLTCTLRCRIEIRGEDGTQAGFAEAEVRRAAVRPAGSPAERARAAEELVRAAGADLNVEFEYQIRRNLRAMLAPVAAPPAAPRLDI
ncbi:hypothetical protein [Roseomonas sp. CECT 9278]|uniref:hypothetical protein n=1 Tax=Roseomonas sp. CECT 9278 TaxID=2845823 RepID=UPI001E4946A5|nr:hypothetical protein [Roseomonas sp. CECT 9278]